MVNRNFFLMWIGKIISQLGDKFYSIALAWWILEKTSSPAIMGFFLIASTLPSILLGFFAGALVDHWKRKTILIITDIIRGGLVLIISWLAISDILEVWHVFIIGVCLSITTSFFQPAVQAIIPEIVEKDDLTKANGMSQMVGGICTVAGPLLGAITVSIFGIAVVFMVNSISYFISAFLACFIVINVDYKKASTEKHLWKDICEGICFLKKNKQIILILQVIAIAHFFMGGLMVSLPFLANGLQGDGIKNLGSLQMAMGAGLITGSLFLSIKKNSCAKENKLILFIAVFGIGLLEISILQIIRVQTIYSYMLSMLTIGICIAFASVFWQSLLQRHTPSYITGRVFSISSLVGNISLPIAYGVFGVLLDLVSIHQMMLGCGLCLVGICSYLYIRLPVHCFE